MDKARQHRSACRASSCPSWDRTRTLLIQSQACCQLHQGAPKSAKWASLLPICRNPCKIVGGLEAFNPFAATGFSGKRMLMQLTVGFGQFLAVAPDVARIADGI